MENLKLRDFLDYKYLSTLNISPDGKYAAFVVHSMNYDDNKYLSNIWILEIATNKYRKLTSLDEEKSYFWLNNTTIIFESVRDKKIKDKIEEGEKWTCYYSIDINGGEANKYMDIPLQAANTKMIDEDRYIVLSKFDNYEIEINNLKGEERAKAVKLYKENKDYEILDEIPFWKNGKGFTNKKRMRLYIYNKKDNTVKPITCEHTEVEYFSYKDEQVLYTGKVFKDKYHSTSGIFIYDIRKDVINTIIPDGKYTVKFAEFLDDAVICSLSDMKKYGVNENTKFYIIKNGKEELLKDHNTSMASTVGSDCKYGGGKQFRISNGKLYFPTTVNKSSYINSIDIKGNEVCYSIDGGSIDVYDVYNDTILFIGLRGTRLQEVYSLKDKKETQITNFNEKIYTEKKISKPEKLNFVSDGIEIEGMILFPVDYDENKTYPAILDIHGGPKTVYGDVFFHEMQVWANMGYFVLFCNPRGSDGRGNEFADIRGKYGTIDYDDFMRFVDAAINKYKQIDKNRLGVTGGSYGGYMTNWIIGHTERFKCAASQRSIANWTSKFCTTDIGYYFNADQISATPWENNDKLWFHSPLKYADKAKTPTLFIHSDEDYRCWIAEGLQMFTALKYYGVEARLCMFRGENHELSRSGKPKHRVRRLEEITNWFEKHLKN